MDQVKEILRQVVKYRFWISIAIATLFAGGAYVLGSGPIQKSTDEATGKINSAAKDVQQYSSPSVPTKDYEPIVVEKTGVLTKDVDVAWKELYDRQAPLLTWPEGVDRFRKWGRKWPTEEAADSAVELAIIDYTEAYKKYVEDVFKVFRPFDYESGEGIVASPPSEILLRPSNFDTNKKRPKLGEVWSSQERLWAQRTVLEVVRNVNRNAKDWDSAYVKEIKALEVGNATAQDQQSMAAGVELEGAEPITAPNEPEEEEGADAGGGMMGGMMPMMMGAGMAGKPGGSQEPEEVVYLKPEGGATQYKILPIMITVLVDQDHVQDLLVELENSPMAIEVKEPELRRPQSRVTKPEKGVPPMGYGGMMGGMNSMMMGRGMMGGRGAMGYGGMNSMMMNMGSMMGRGGMRGGGGNEMMNSMMTGMGGTAAAEKKGEDRRSVVRAEERQEAMKAIDAVKASMQFDPYFNIVEVTVYGQARFYNEPPAAVEEEPSSPGDAAAAAPGDEPAKAEAATEPGKADAPQTETPKAEGPDAKPKPESAPAEPAETDPAAPAPKADAAAPADAPKADAPKADAPKADTPKAAPDEAEPAVPKS